jgi:hypothetical protein
MFNISDRINGELITRKSDANVFLNVNILGLGSESRTDASSLVCGGQLSSFPVTTVSGMRINLLCGLDHKPRTYS